MMLLRIRAAAVGVALLVASSSALALNPSLDVSQFVHTAWRIREGLVRGPITAIAQTPDGYLWLGTEFGLLRFDGVRSVPWRPPPDQRLPSSAISALLAARDGSLWIGTLNGLASWNGRTITHYAELPGMITKFLEDRRGAIWVTQFAHDRFGLCVIRQGRVDCSGNEDVGLNAVGLFEDRAGVVWAGVSNGVWRWDPGPRGAYLWGEEPNGVQGMADGDNGSLLMSTRGEVKRLVNGRVETAFRLPAAARRFQAPIMRRDRDGGLWVGTLGGGLVHEHEGRTDVFTHADGLSSDAISAVYEDREGN